ncbi:SDR family NAD(P)-dependent oxidoreductase [Pontibacter beigongshangensis]|uniref:SDR family NAD(P)-dependent oxidoreductase n=1 Tax=Pontibacter beigongshangensis TaxID=2574733 RepID=UPI0016509014|nr:SDR family oxidoreductase [Pontibacter beigongshangensis]
MNNLLSLKNELALITGGGTGIGFGIAAAFVQAGARVVISGRKEEVLQKAVAELGENATYLVNDISEQKGIPDFVQQVETQWGPVSILVNNAGRHLKKPMSETTDEEYLAVLQTNLLSVFSLSREVANRMSQRNKGSILLISSMSAFMAMDRVVAYTTAKTALTGLMRGMVADYSKYGIRINAIAPGWIESDMLHKAIEADPERKAKIMGRIPFKQFGKPADIGHAALFLSSGAASYINGVLMPVDGGAAYAF